MITRSNIYSTFRTFPHQAACFTSFIRISGLSSVGREERGGEAAPRHQTQPWPAVLPELRQNLVWNNAPWGRPLQDQVLSAFPWAHPRPRASLQLGGLREGLPLPGREQDEPQEEVFRVVKAPAGRTLPREFRFL